MWNLGTPEFTPAIRKIVKKIPFQHLLDDIVVEQADVKRGNYQVSFGLTSGHCPQAGTRENVLKHFGASVPALRKGTKENLELLRTLTELAREIGMEVARDEYLLAHPDVKAEVDFVASEIGDGVCHGLVTVCFCKQDKGKSRVTEHIDDKNGDKAPEVMVAAATLKDKEGE